MPKQIDHDARKRLVAEAVCALAAERGIEGVTLRDVAERAELSMGAVQRSFATRESMLIFAVQHIGHQIMSRVKARLGSAAAGPERAAERLQSLAIEIAMIDPAQRSHAGVWLAFMAEAAVSPPLAAYVQSSYGALEKAFVRLIRALNPKREALLEARGLLALIDGLTTHVLVRQLSPRSARNILEAHVRALERA